MNTSIKTDTSKKIWTGAVAALLVPFCWWGFWGCILRPTQADVSWLGQIGDAFAPFTGVGSMLAVAFAAWSIRLQQKEIHDSTEELGAQRRHAATLAIIQAQQVVVALDARLDRIADQVEPLLKAIGAGNVNARHVGRWEWSHMIDDDAGGEDSDLLRTIVPNPSDEINDAFIRARSASHTKRETEKLISDMQAERDKTRAVRSA